MAAVSIIVPVYKTKQSYLEQCIESLIGQTCRDIEIILVDDGSPDECGAICDQYAAKDARIKVLHQENQGVSVARNHGIDMATGDYILFVDADDWLEKDCVEVTWRNILNHSSELLLFQHVIEYRNKSLFPKKAVEKELTLYDFEQMQLTLLRDERFYNGYDQRTAWGKIIKRECLNINVRFPHGLVMAEDIVFNLLLLEHISSAYSVDYTGYHYRMIGESVTHRYRPQAMAVALSVMNEFERFVVNYHTNEAEYKNALGEGSLSLLRIIEKSYTFHKECTLSRKEIIRVADEYWKHPLIQKCSSQCDFSNCRSLKGKIRYLLQFVNPNIYYVVLKIASGYKWRW